MDFDSSIQKKSRMKKADMKIVILGDMDVGKTSLVLRYIERRFEDTVSTIGASFLLKQWGNYNIAIWDTAGEEKYQGLNLFYCRNTAAAILVFDLTIHKSFETLQLRYLPLLESLNGFILKIVIGSKLDLLQNKERKVEVEEAQEFAKRINEGYCQENKIPYFETSSVNGRNVDLAFETIFEHFFPGRGLKPRPQTPNKYGFHHLDRGSVSLMDKSVNYNEDGKWKGWSCCS